MQLLQVVGGKRKVPFTDGSSSQPAQVGPSSQPAKVSPSSQPAQVGSSSQPAQVGSSSQTASREDCFNICYQRKRPTYEEAISGSARKHWKPLFGFATQPPHGYGLYTDFTTANMILNVSYVS